MVIVGAGASGLASAIALARVGVDVKVLEANSKVARKILVSGNGRCNISNRYISAKRYHSKNPKFIKEALKGCNQNSINSFLNSIGLELEEEREGKLFPMGKNAKSVVELLVREAKRLGVEIVTECKVEKIEYKGGKFILDTSKGRFIDRKLLLSSGSISAPQLGGSRDGLEFAKALGHRLLEPLPALVALETSQKWTKLASGVKIFARVKLIANNQPLSEKEGDILFTDYGLSGLAVLDISKDVSLNLDKSIKLSIDLLPKFTKEALSSLLLKRVNRSRDLPINLWLEGVLHKKLVSIILKESKVDIASEADLNRKVISKIVYTIKNLKVDITKTRGFRYAEVALGGVDTKEVNPNTLESLRVPNLYFSGEILDITGDRGGFNFYWAWCSALKVSRALKP